ncbi:MAG: hypothetical protein PHX08_26260 [Lachnospiraceae bacterium]|nr:hypothetical protein [Lachnospiraceae bacterium]
MSNYIPGILFILIGLVMMVLTIKGCAIDKKNGWILSGIFMAIGVAFCIIMYFQAYKWYAAVLGFPIGIISLWQSIRMTKDCIACSQKTEGTYIQPVFNHYGRHREKYYSISFTYFVDSRKIRSKTEDCYRLEEIEKRFEPHVNCKIYYHPRHPDKIRFKRFYGFIAGICGLIIGVVFIGFAVGIVGV